MGQCMLESEVPLDFEKQVGFGQTICTPLRPRCAKCTVSEFCPSAFKEISSTASTSKTRRPKKEL
uniref:Uncharacterized protein n=1 Tax=Solanum tuberosum TaxID=4113 RepID=M1A6A8_SOLTU